ncbi:MAG TPA: response regulator [Ktedonobacteraceae bacterium]|nr:response regulator [Ktedonobacteraceae bacterium]
MASEGGTARLPGSEKIILIVDDDLEVGDVLQKIITENTNYQTVWIAEGDLALAAAHQFRPSLILLDYMLPIMDGLKLYDRMQEIETIRGVPVVLISALATLPFEELRERGIYLLRKPFELGDLLDIVAQLLTD